MKSSLRLLFAALLSFAVIVTASPFQLYFKAIAQEASGPADSADFSEEMEKSLQQLRDSFTGEMTQANLDPFQLTRQIVVDDRRSNIQAVNEQVALDDYREFMEDKQRELVELETIENKVIEKLATASEEKAKQFNLIIQDIQSRRKMVNLEIEDRKNFDPSKGAGINTEFMVDQQISPRHYWGNRMRLLIRQSGELVGEVPQRSFTESLSPRFSSENPLGELLKTEGPIDFSIANAKGEAMHHFLNPVEAVFFFGDFLVYIEKAAEGEVRKSIPIRFIDLRYAKVNIGNAPLPVFTMPLNITEEPKDFRIENGYLKIGGQKLNYQQFGMVSQSQQVLFNVAAALVDGEAFKSSKPLVADILEFFEKSMKTQDKLFQEQMNKAISNTDYLKSIGAALEAKESISLPKAREALEKAMANDKLSTAEYEMIKKGLDAGEGIEATNQALTQGRSFMTRLHLLFRFLVQPRPEGSPKLLKAMLIAMTSRQSGERGRVWELANRSKAFRMAKYGAGIGGALLAGSQLPEPYKINLYKSLDLVSAISEHFQGYMRNINYGRAYADLSVDAAFTSISGYWSWPSAYLTDGKWAKFLYGLGQVLLIPLKLFAGIHFTVNSFKMFAGAYKIRSLSTEKRGFLRSFIRAAEKDSKDYFDSLAEAEKKVSGSDVSKMTDAEIELLEQKIDRLKSGRDSLKWVERDIKAEKYGQRSAIRNFISVLHDYQKKFHFGQAISDAFAKMSARLAVKEGTLRSALAKSFMSYSSLRTTFKFNATVWNFLFMTRSYAWSPPKWLMFFTYPNFFKVAAATREGHQHFPSKYNRGLDLWSTSLRRVLSNAGAGKAISRAPLIKSFFLSQEALDNLRIFEGTVHHAEAIAMEIAKKKAQKAVVKHIQDPKVLMQFFDSTERSGEVSTGIRNLHDKKIRSLTTKDRVYYQAYMTRTFDTLMQNFVNELAETQVDPKMDPAEFAKRFAQEMRAGNVAQFDFTPEAIEKVEARVEGNVDFKEVARWAESVASESSQVRNRFDIRWRHNLLKSIHPRDPQVNRFLTARKKVNEPRAMERATRMEVSSLLTSLPIGILSTLGLYAAVQTGDLMPFDPNGLDTKTHFNYMSRYLFYNGFIPGLIIGLMADTWMKVQEDARIDSLGGFDKAPTNADSKKGFWRYFFKNVFKNPVNKWSQNQIYMLKLITANIPAAAITIIVSNLYGLGRIDVGAFLTSYIVIYTTIFIGYGVKISQAFELASSWFYNKIPRKLRAHKKAQQYVNGQIQRQKFRFSIYMNIFDIVIQENIAGTMVTLKDNVKHGTRAFARFLFGGDTPTIIIVNAADKIAEAFGKVPGVEKAMSGVKHLFSNQYPAFERFPERLIGDAPKPLGQPDLPKSFVGEVVGKAAGAAATIGAVTVAPYILSDMKQKRRESNIQRQGRRLRCGAIFSK